MIKAQVDIDFKVMSQAMREHVRRKASRAGSTIIYKKDGALIEEDPTISKKTVLKKAPVTK